MPFIKKNLSRNQNTVLKKNKNRKQSSTLWLKRQLNDIYVLNAKKEGYYSRAAYKFLEINEKFHIIKNKHAKYRIIDLGAAPGGWSQVIAKESPMSKIIALDLLDIKDIPGIIKIKGDFLDPLVAQEVIKSLEGEKADIIVSDMAPNTTGNREADHLRIMNLVESSYEFCLNFLKKDGVFVTKVFQGGTESELLQDIKQKFSTVKHFKPNSSRKESKEIYLVAMGFRG